MPDNFKKLLGRIGSYSAVDGRSAKAANTETGDGPVVGGGGQTWPPMARGTPGGNAPSWAEWEASKCQNPTPVSKRSLG